METLTTIAPPPWRLDDRNERRADHARRFRARPAEHTRTSRNGHGGGESTRGSLTSEKCRSPFSVLTSQFVFRFRSAFRVRPTSGMGKPFVVISGLPASGKTTLDRRLAPTLNLPIIDKDDILDRLFKSKGVGKRSVAADIEPSDGILQHEATRSDGDILASFWRLPHLEPRRVNDVCLLSINLRPPPAPVRRVESGPPSPDVRRRQASTRARRPRRTPRGCCGPPPVRSAPG